MFLRENSSARFSSGVGIDYCFFEAHEMVGLCYRAIFYQRQLFLILLSLFCFWLSYTVEVPKSDAGESLYHCNEPPQEIALL